MHDFFKVIELLGYLGDMFTFFVKVARYLLKHLLHHSRGDAPQSDCSMSLSNGEGQRKQ